VHDLRHDGKLYTSKEVFLRNAHRINGYLDQWGAVGFRSGFMLHNLHWLHHLKVEYDASTFDTDPFEPQPHGRGTIFPFWMGAPATSKEHAGYVELPYTLPQDSTLFLLLAEKHPDVWFQKLDWIARHGGMALIDTHPDYMAFDGNPREGREYDVNHYVRLLEYVKTKYEGKFWNPLAKDLARWYKREVVEPEIDRSRGEGRPDLAGC
jgi:hypothetical protein